MFGYMLHLMQDTHTRQGRANALSQSIANSRQGISLTVGIQVFFAAAASHAAAEMTPLSDRTSISHLTTCAATAIVFDDGSKTAQFVKSLLIRQIAERAALARIEHGHPDTPEDWIEYATVSATGDAAMLEKMMNADRSIIPFYEQIYLECITEGVSLIGGTTSPKK